MYPNEHTTSVMQHLLSREGRFSGGHVGLYFETNGVEMVAGIEIEMPTLPSSRFYRPSFFSKDHIQISCILWQYSGWRQESVISDKNVISK